MALNCRSASIQNGLAHEHVEHHQGGHHEEEAMNINFCKALNDADRVSALTGKSIYLPEIS